MNTINHRNITFYVGVLLAVASLNSMAAKEAHGASGLQRTDVCSVLNNPRLYLNKEISLRGSIFTGVDSANIRDAKCPDKGIDLSVEKSRYEQPDIVSFFQRVRIFGNHGFATIVGKFIATDSPIRPYSISIHKVHNVTRLETGK